MNSVVTLEDLLVAAGWTTEHGDTDAAVWTSRDGQRWTRVQDAALIRPGQQDPREVIAAGPGLVMVGMDGSRNPLDPQDRRPSQPAVWTSTDGQTWQEQTLPVPAATRTMTYQLAAVTQGGPGLDTGRVRAVRLGLHGEIWLHGPPPMPAPGGHWRYPRT